MIGIMFDVLIIGLLAANVVYLLKVNRQFKVMQEYKKELDNFAGKFHEVLLKAEKLLGTIYVERTKVASQHQQLVQKSEAIIEDLRFLNERAENSINILSQRNSQTKNIEQIYQEENLASIAINARQHAQMNRDPRAHNTPQNPNEGYNQEIINAAINAAIKNTKVSNTKNYAQSENDSQLSSQPSSMENLISILQKLR